MSLELNAMQRKALRRLGRKQTINRTQRNDPLIKRCIDTSHYIGPPDIKDVPFPESMIMWCDWEAKASAINRPRLNDYGKRLLEELEQPTPRE